ncbi:MAG: tetratricopeptide repeat protein [Bacteroidales bacterium]|nr:tetratricopeptide repeat protein [Bacteroidales bacterium]
MKKLLPILLFFCLLPLVAWGQENRNEIIAQSRYLRSVLKTDEAVELLSTLVTPERMDVEVLSELADCHFQSGNYEDAAGLYNMLSLVNPGNLLFKLRKMQIFYRVKAWPQAVEAGKEVLALDSIPAVLGYVGDGFKQLNQADSALWYYRRSLALKPQNATTVSKVFDILLGREAYDQAIDLTDKYLTDDPDNPVVAPLGGLARYRKGAYDAAADIFERQLELGNDTYPIHYYLGQSYWHTTRAYRADKELLTAWQMDSSDVNLAYSIAALRADLHLPFQEIKPWLDRAWEMSQPDNNMLYLLHRMYAQGMGKSPKTMSQAIDHYREAYRLNPKYKNALLQMGYLYETLSDRQKAISYYERYLKESDPENTSSQWVNARIKFLQAENFMQ